MLDMFVDMLLSGPHRVYNLGTLPSGRYSGDIPSAILVSTSLEGRSNLYIASDCLISVPMSSSWLVSEVPRGMQCELEVVIEAHPIKQQNTHLGSTWQFY